MTDKPGRPPNVRGSSTWRKKAGVAPLNPDMWKSLCALSKTIVMDLVFCRKLMRPISEGMHKMLLKLLEMCLTLMYTETVEYSCSIAGIEAKVGQRRE